MLFLGLTSLFTDISSEMVTTVLPLYVLVNLNLTPMAFGVVDGLYLGAAAVVRLAGGFLADRTAPLQERRGRRTIRSRWSPASDCWRSEAPGDGCSGSC